MIVGIDASNVRAGGGLTHLSKLLEAVDPAAHGIRELVVWSGRATLDLLPRKSWLRAVHEPLLDRALPHRLYWQRRRLPAVAADACDVLFVPGGNAARQARPVVTMSRNMLPFEPHELFRYGLSATTLRLLLLRLGQARTFRRADGVIFLTRYARDSVTRLVPVGGKIAVIPHGIDERFRAEPRPQEPIERYSAQRPFRLLYVSIIDLYKHPWHVAEAVSGLRRAGIPVTIDFVGPAYPAALRRFQSVLARLDAAGECLRYRGAIPFRELHACHRSTDAFVFASSCENMPNSLLEAMAAGLPIACAERGPMPEILADGGLYFDPESPPSIARALERLVGDAGLRGRLSGTAYARAREFSWERCARETFAFVSSLAAPGGAARAAGVAGPGGEQGSLARRA
jgi:glycosyltransferase involved in cell wall biosynthesis